VLVFASPAGSAPGKVTCTGPFTGAATDVVVPPNAFCDLEGATIQHDVVVQTNAVLQANNTTIGHDLTATKVITIQTGFSGPVNVGHDLTVSGSNAPGFAGHAVCDTTVGHDLRFTGTVNTGFLIRRRHE
jgi:hypothetical protein